MGKPKTKPAAKKKTKFEVERSGGIVKIKHRGKFVGAGAKLKVAKNEDRRHLLHLDEQLKPVLSRVFTALEQENQGDQIKTLAVVRKHMEKRGMKRLPKSLDEAFVRITNEVNSSGQNLVPDDAAINKAIEHLRADLRTYVNEAATSTAKVFMDESPTLLAAEMLRLRTLADTSFAAKNEHTPIQDARDVMTASVRELIKLQDSPAAVHALVNDLQYSVTFDLSAKAKREQTEAMLKWQRDMAAAASWTATEQLDRVMDICGT